MHYPSLTLLRSDDRCARDAVATARYSSGSPPGSPAPAAAPVAPVAPASPAAAVRSPKRKSGPALRIETPQSPRAQLAAKIGDALRALAGGSGHFADAKSGFSYATNFAMGPCGTCADDDDGGGDEEADDAQMREKMAKDMVLVVRTLLNLGIKAGDLSKDA